MALDSPYIGHVVTETDDKIVIFGSFSIGLKYIQHYNEKHKAEEKEQAQI